MNLQDFLKSGTGSRLSLGLVLGRVDVFSGYRCLQGCIKLLRTASKTPVEGR